MPGKHSKHWHKRNDYWTYTYDGMYDKERIKGKDKQYEKKRRRHYEHKLYKEELDTYGKEQCS